MLGLVAMLATAFATPPPSVQGPGGRYVTLGQIAPGQPLAILVVKGTWCPICMEQVSQLASKPPGVVIALSNEDLEALSRASKTFGMSFFRDADGKLAKSQDLWNESDGHPSPGVLFVDQCGDVRFTVKGRRPGLDQTSLVADALETMRANPPKCQTDEDPQS